VVDSDGVSPHFVGVLARLDEAQAQYRADQERAISDDELRQAEFAKLVDENRAKDEQTLAEVAERAQVEGTLPDSSPSEDEKWAARRAQQEAADAAIFAFEDDLPVESAVEVKPETPALAQVESVWTEPPKAKVEPRRRTWEDDEDFSRTDWTSES
jgi:predicted GNAT family acetyltransferase